VRAAPLLGLALACNSPHATTIDAPPAPTADAYLPIDATNAITGLSVSPSSATISWPLSQPLQVLAIYSDDAQLDVTPFATYTSSAPEIAGAPTQGLIDAVGPGRATITASYLGATGTMTATIVVPTLAVATSNAVELFDASAIGSATPRSSISGPSTTIGHACGIAELGGELFVADDVADAIDVWSIADSGDVAPERTITTSFTPVSIAAAGSAIYVGASDGVRVFAANASGSATPLQTIAGSATTISGGAGVAVYQGELYVVSSTTSSVAVFPLASSGNIAPKRVIAGPSAGLANPIGIAVGQGLELVTVDQVAGQVQAFVPTGSGDVAPFGNFSGDQTDLVSPTSVAVDQTIILVGTPSTQSIEVLAISNDFGDFPPVETITGIDVQALALF
jgi:hypothetical protein